MLIVRRLVETTKYISLVPQSVETFTYKIERYSEFALNPAVDAANYLSSTTGLDEFSIALRNLSMRLRELHLEYVRISSALFWPSTKEEDASKQSKLYWPNLEVLEILSMPPI